MPILHIHLQIDQNYDGKFFISKIDKQNTEYTVRARTGITWNVDPPNPSQGNACILGIEFHLLCLKKTVHI